MSEYFGKDVPKLGFGLMRLPKLEDGTIDIEQTKQMVDRFLAAGFTYFDTAYVYAGSEDAARQALVERHPRDSYTLATKINAMAACTDEESCKRQFQTSFDRTQAGYFDYYLLHALQTSNFRKYDDYHIWDFVHEQKEKGLVKHMGFSFHATPELLDELLTKHPEVDFVQLQLNYADWDNPSITSRANYEVARAHGKSIVVMEPIKGGTLAAPPQQVADILKAAEPEASLASWAIRYVASLDGIITVLSGMSDMQQMEDNVSYMEHFSRSQMTSRQRSGVHRRRSPRSSRCPARPATTARRAALCTSISRKSSRHSTASLSGARRSLRRRAMRMQRRKAPLPRPAFTAASASAPALSRSSA